MTCHQWPILVAILLGLCLVGLVHGQHSLSAGVVGCGGGEASAETQQISGTIGQPIIGAAGNSGLSIGFWHTGASFLPAVPITVITFEGTQAQVHFQNMGHQTYRLYGGTNPGNVNLNGPPLAITVADSVLIDTTASAAQRKYYVVTASNP